MICQNTLFSLAKERDILQGIHQSQKERGLNILSRNPAWKGEACKEAE